MRRRAFTLVEMMVSLAVLALALSVLGVVFSITTRVASQAAAYSEALHWARQAAEQLKADLAQCDPSTSLLVLVGRTQRAGLTADDVAAQRFLRVFTGVPGQENPSADVEPQALTGYSDPRADILAFITNRPMASVAPPLDPNSGGPYAAGARLAPVLVVYGHAALGEAGWNGSSFLWPQTVRHIHNPGETSPIPAAEWHLARRATILRQEEDSTEHFSFDDGARARIALCAPTLDEPGDAATLNLAGLLAELERRDYARYLYGPYEIYDEDRDLQTWVDGLLYGPPGGAPRRHVATVIAPEVPVELRSNLGVHLLPGCTWFQVEFLMPEDPRNSVEYAARLDGSDGGVHRARLSLWTPVPDGQTYVFIPDSRENRARIVQGGLNQFDRSRLAQFSRIDQNPLLHDDGVDVVASRRVRLWPYAIRVTFHVYDPRGRLEHPIIRSVVHRFE